MHLYLLYSNKDDGEILEVTVFRSLEEAVSYAEPIDVVDGEYAGAYCTDGTMYDVRLDERKTTQMVEIGRDLELVETRLRRNLEFRGLLDTSVSLRENLAKYVISGGPSDFFFDMFRAGAKRIRRLLR